MDIFSELKIGDKLDIQRYKDDGVTKEENFFRSQVINIQDECIHISPPIYQGKKYHLHKDQEISVFFYTEKGIYQFNAEVVDKGQDNITSFSIVPISQPQKIQRRNYYRLPLVINVALKRYAKGEIVTYQCLTRDLSGGGVKIVCKEALEEKETVVVDIYLSEKDLVSIKGEVVRVIYDNVNNNYEIGIKFKDVDEIDEDRIFAFIFEKQRLLLKKGLI